MHLSTHEQTALSRVFGLLADDLAEREIRTRLGQALVDLLRADHFASFVWDEPSQRFGNGVWLAMDASNLARYDGWFQYNDPITFALQARRHATLVSEVMPHRALQRTEFFNDFLARDGLHWGINLHAFDGGRALGDLRIWRGKHRREFEPHDKALLDLIEPAFIAALKRSQPPPPWSAPASDAVSVAVSVVRVAQAVALPPSPRELAVARCVARGLTDKQIARELGLAVCSVRTYLGRLAHKAGVNRRAGLAQWAAQWAAQAPMRVNDEPPPGA